MSFALALTIALVLPFGAVIAQECDSTCANSVYDYYQGTEKDGSAVQPARSDPDNALGSIDHSFFSLGYVDETSGGWIIVEFEEYVGTCLTVVEQSPGIPDDYPLEQAEVYVSADSDNPTNWTYLGIANNQICEDPGTGKSHLNIFDLEECIKFVKIVDITDPTPHGNTADAFDLDSVCAGPCLGIEITKEADRENAHEGDIISYNYSVHNNGNVPLTAPTVIDSLGITINPVLDGHTYNIGDDNDDGVFDCCETWNFTADYTVEWFYDCYTVENTANASASYEAIVVTNESNLVAVNIERNPAIEVRKSGLTNAYFQSVNAPYTYEVENVGDCGLLNVVLSDDMTSPVYVSGDTGDADVMIPGEIWVYEATELLECECETITCFTNKATVTAEDIKGEPVDDEACWTVLVFQWQPRTIGYWGNWDNHYTTDEITALVNAVKRQSCHFADIDLQVGDVHDLLLGKVKGRMTVDKATALLEKQLLATWFNVKSYEDWVGDIAIPTFEGSPDAAMDPNAMVYVDGEAMTVQEILDRIEYNICTNPTSDIQFLLKAKDILDDMNNAENNSYAMFIPPWFDADACPLVLENKDPSDWSIIVDEMYGKLFYSAAGDEFEYIFCGCGLDADTDYSLIYYADTEDRYVDWGGDNPGALITEMTTDGCGSVFKAGSIDLGWDLPHPDDANGYYYDYTQAPDYYDNGTGAKIWLVPSTDYNGVDKVTTWSPDDFLFETDLIWYEDTDD